MTMGFWLFMLVMDLLIPVTVLIVGWAFVKHPPKTMNGAVGYRTRRSMRTPQTWLFAHRYCGRFWKIGGWILLPCSVLPMLPVLGRNDDTVGIVGLVVCTALLIPLIVSVCLTERALKRTFDETGRRR